MKVILAQWIYATLQKTLLCDFQFSPQNLTIMKLKLLQVNYIYIHLHSQCRDPCHGQKLDLQNVSIQTPLISRFRAYEILICHYKIIINPVVFSRWTEL